MKKNNSSLSEQQKFMKMAIAEAKQARILDEVPIGGKLPVPGPQPSPVPSP